MADSPTQALTLTRTYTHTYNDTLSLSLPLAFKLSRSCRFVPASLTSQDINRHASTWWQGPLPEEPESPPTPPEPAADAPQKVNIKHLSG